MSGTGQSMTIFPAMENLPGLEAPDDVDVASFVEYGNVLPSILGHLGKSFYLARKDIEGNIKQVCDGTKANPTNLTTLRKLFQYEVDQKLNTNIPSSTNGMRWFCRGMEFVVLFLKELLKEFKEGNTNESLVPLLQSVYERTLQQYHNFIVKKTFSVAMHASPKRSNLIRSMAVDDSVPPEKVYAEMETLLAKYEVFIQRLYHLRAEFNIEEAK